MLKTKAEDWLLSCNKYNKALPPSKKVGNGKAITISVSSGKGGVGKTSVALKFGLLLAGQGSKVLLVDCDYNLSNLHIKLNIRNQNSFYSLYKGEKKFNDCLFKRGNFHLLSGGNGDAELFNNVIDMDSFLIGVISRHERDYDYIILDCPAGISKEVLTLNAYCDERIVVVTPDKSSITDSYSLIKLLNLELGINSNCVLANKIVSSAQYKRIVNSISSTVDSFLNCRINLNVTFIKV